MASSSTSFPITETPSPKYYDTSIDIGKVDPDQLKEFIEKIRFSSGQDTDLFENIPSGLKPEDIINLIFEEAHFCDYIFEDFIEKFPSYQLSSFDTVRSAIVMNSNKLDNASLETLLRDNGLMGDEKKVAACYDLAFRLWNSKIYQISPTPILSKDYTLNFLWINLNPQDRINDIAQNIFKDGLDLTENAECIKDPALLRDLKKTGKSLTGDDKENWKKIKKSFVYRISKWADVNPNTEINLWYDSALVTKKAQEKTFEMMNAISQSRGVNLHLRDVRQLPILKNRTLMNCLHPGAPVYFRVDLLKVLIADYMMSSSEKSSKYFVYSDIDVKPMESKQLFDLRTLKYLSANGYVFVQQFGKFENSFFIFNCENEQLREVHKTSMITLPIRHIDQARKLSRYRYDIYTFGSEYIFNQYSHFRQKMSDDVFNNHYRKLVEAPRSQFNRRFSKTEHQAETFRFIGGSEVPCTENGRNSGAETESPIPSLKDWKAEPLPLPDTPYTVD